MSEFITIQVGQCGNQIGGAFWPLVLEEYGLRTVDGKNCSTTNKKDLLSSFNSFFVIPPGTDINSFTTTSNLIEAKVKARSILVDMEESVINRYVRRGALRDIFDPKCIVANQPGSGNNWAEGFCTHGPRFEAKLLGTICRAVEKCDSLQGFLLMLSVGGGTGSGLGSYILELLEDNFPTIERFVTCVYPTGTEDVITCPYNMALATKQITDHASCVFPVENRALLDIISREATNTRHLNDMFYKAQSSNSCNPFQDMNSLIVNMLMHLTCSARFQGSFNVDFNDISTNMVPFPEMHFLSSSFSPVLKCRKQVKLKDKSHQLKDEMFRTCCSRSNQLLKLDPLSSKSVLLGATLIGRGDFNVSDMRNYVNQIQTKARFTSWSRKSIRTGLCDIPPSGNNSAILCLFNTSSVSLLFSYILESYRKLYKKKAHVHHYTQVPGFDIQYFKECENSLLSNIESYRQVENNIL